MSDLPLFKTTLCDIYGVQLADITRLCEDRKITEQHNTPQTYTFSVDASDPKVAGIHTDGAPKLDYIRRVIKFYRLEYNPILSRLDYRLRFAGFVWPLNDDGDENGDAITRVTAMNPLVVLNQRFARDAAGSWVSVPFDTVQAGVAWHTLIDRTNTFAGPMGLTTTGATRETTDTIKVNWQYKLMNEVTSELTRGMDIWCEPIDTIGSITHARAHVLAKRGSDLGLTLGWNSPVKNNLSAISRAQDPTDAVNVLVGFGSTSDANAQLASIGVDTNNIGRYHMQLEGLQTYSDVRDQNHLDNLVASDLYDRLPPQEGITVTPFDGIDPWTDFNVGDTGYVIAGDELRGGITKRQERIYGFTLNIDNDNNPTTELVTNQDS